MPAKAIDTAASTRWTALNANEDAGSLTTEMTDVTHTAMVTTT